MARPDPEAARNEGERTTVNNPITVQKTNSHQVSFIAVRHALSGRAGAVNATNGRGKALDLDVVAVYQSPRHFTQFLL